MNYGQLKSSIATWLHREDLSTVIPTFVTLAESAIARDVRLRAMETRQTGTTTGEIDLPDDFLSMRAFVLDDVPMLYLTPAEWHAYNDAGGEGRYTIAGTKVYSAAGDYQLDYWARFSALASDSDTNWLLTNHPDVYLFSSLRQAAIYIRDDDYAQQMQQEYLKSVLRAQQTDTASRYGNDLQVRVEGYIV